MQASSSAVRPASAADAAACAAIYRPYVENTAISWELEVPRVDEMASRISGLRTSHEWLVLEDGGRIIGFAYGQPLKRLPTFEWTTETGIYLDEDRHRSGGGRQLYTRLLSRLTERGYRRAFAGITHPNEASNGFHQSFGYQQVGLYRRAFWKLGSWHDVAWLQLDLAGNADDDDGPPSPIG